MDEYYIFTHALRCGKVLFRKEEVQILETAIREDAAELARLRAEVKRLREMRSRLKRLPRYYIEQWNGQWANLEQREDGLLLKRDDVFAALSEEVTK